MQLKTCLLLSAAAILPGSAMAQGVIELDEAFVFSGLLPVEVNRTGTTVEIVEGEELAFVGQGVENALNRLPGISLSSNGGLGTESGVRIRGLSSYYVGVTFDGIDVTDPAATQNLFNFGQFTKAGVGRIEVAKGAQTAVYGSDAIAGAINITSWRPETLGTSGQSSLEVGSYGSASAAVSFGYLDDDTEIAMSLSRIVTDGFSAREEDTEDDGFQQSMLTFSVSEDVSESVTLGGSLFFADEVTEFDNANFDPMIPGPVRPDGGSDGQRFGARVFAKVAGDRVDHEFAVSTFRRDRVENLGGGFLLPFTGDRTKVSYLGTTDVSPALQLAFGADWVEEEFTSGGDSGDDSNGGVFGEAQYALSDMTDLSFSLRHDVYSNFDDQTTGRLALVHRGGNGLTYRASLATGYRAPSLYERFAGFGTGNPDLLPEESIGAELGIEKAYDGGVVSATLFRSEIDNLIEYSFDTFSYAQSADKTVTQGIEFAGEWALGAATLFGGYTFTDAKTGTARALRVPRHELSLGVASDLTERLGASVDVQVARDIVDISGPLDDYAVANATLTYEISDSMDAYLRVENLFDADYQTVDTYNMPGRSVFVGLRASF